MGCPRKGDVRQGRQGRQAVLPPLLQGQDMERATMGYDKSGMQQGRN